MTTFQIEFRVGLYLKNKSQLNCFTGLCLTRIIFHFLLPDLEEELEAVRNERLQAATETHANERDAASKGMMNSFIV